MLLPSTHERKQTVGDVAFGRMSSTGIQIDKITFLDKTNRIIPEKFMVKFNQGGSGFMLNKLKIPIQVNNEFIIGIIITAGHCVCDTSTFIPKEDSYECTINNKVHNAVFLKSFMDDFMKLMISASNQNYFIHSGDLALLLLKSPKIISLNSFPLASNEDVRIGSKVYLAGYPVRPENLLNCCPSLVNAIKEELSKAMDNTFHKFQNLIYSDGNIINKSDCLLDISCTGTNGMSEAQYLKIKEY